MGNKYKPVEVGKKHIQISAKKLAIIVLAIYFLSLALVWLISYYVYNTKNEFPLLNPRLKTYNLDSPEERSSKLFVTLAPLKEELMGYLGENKNNVAFYIEDLNTGSWVGWQEREQFIAASLLKTPISIAVMKKIDKGEWNYETTFALEEQYKDASFGELWKEETGKKITIRRLMELMLEKSDNTAAFILLNHLTLQERDDVFYHIGVANPEDAGEKPTFATLTAKDLASVFRALFNATYLRRASSSYVLDLLTQTEFDQTISKSIPKNIKIAHKIGNFLVPNQEENYHDCGIVYYPEHPYLYCIMTKKQDAKSAENIISTTSLKIFNYFEGAK